MINFRAVTIADKEKVNAVLKLSDFRAAEYSFANIFNWSKAFNTEIAFFEGFLLNRGGGERKSYIYPAGAGNLQAAITALIEDAALLEQPLVLRTVQAEGKQLLEQLFPGRFHFILLRNTFDYIYHSEDLINLSGKKFQPKRNLISRFNKNFEWHYEAIAAGNLQECVRMNEEWCRKYACHENSSLRAETCAVRRALNYFSDESLSGGLLRVGGKVIAYTVGEQTSSDTFTVHIEKAFGEEFPGAYQVINYEFARRHAAHLKYINREDDTGDEGLRKAKLSYRPAFMVEKYNAELITA
ncbi:MAG: phosphatidylglycerol lysyltransferase domain-containing protein [Prevotellaceae bacterium]|jgi:hypothetical protein|nr:phosphatidylglycerol lysyltransferase domain-containing protein [Prevotellaceae bacterium]